MSTKRAISLFWIGCWLVLLPVSAFSQSTSGRITGSIRDPNGAVIVGAEGTVTSIATAEERRFKTDDSGSYTVSTLAPGMYRMTVTANGFKKTEIESIQVFLTESVQ